MKWYWILLLAIIIIGISLYSYINLLKKKIEICVRPVSLNLNPLQISEILSTGETSATLNNELKITNKNKFGVNLKDIRLIFFYEGKRISETKDSKNIKINKNDTTIESFPVELFFNKSSISLARDLIRNQQVELDFLLEFKLLSFTIRIRDKYIYDKNAPATFKNCF